MKYILSDKMSFPYKTDPKTYLLYINANKFSFVIKMYNKYSINN